MSRSIDELTNALDELSICEPHANEQVVPTGERPCPICGEKMTPETMGPATIDVCSQHGMWLDNGELHSILDDARARTNARNRAKLHEAKNDGLTSGALLGVWALALD